MEADVIERTSRDAGSLLNPGKGIIMNVARSFTNWLTYRRAVNELGRLNNRALDDLGISRDQIPALARAAVR